MEIKDIKGFEKLTREALIKLAWNNARAISKEHDFGYVHHTLMKKHVNPVLDKLLEPIKEELRQHGKERNYFPFGLRQASETTTEILDNFSFIFYTAPTPEINFKLKTETLTSNITGEKYTLKTFAMCNKEHIKFVRYERWGQTSVILMKDEFEFGKLYMEDKITFEEMENYLKQHRKMKTTR
jgi:hypothetical protein